MFRWLLLVCLFPFHAEAKIVTKDVLYQHGEVVLEGFLAFDDSIKGKLPGVLVIHEWTGLVDYPKERAIQLAKRGYVAFAADIYGKGIRPKPPVESAKVSALYMNNRALLRERATLGLAELKKQPNVDPRRVAAIGYCFGGTTALELARSGAELNGVASFHGGLSTSMPADPKTMKAKVIVYHGAEDPFVPEADVKKFEDEMRTAQADWTLVKYARAVHAFSNPHLVGAAAMPGKAEYNEVADRRSWSSLELTLKEWLRK